MTIHSFKHHPDIKKSIDEFLDKTKAKNDKLMFEAHNKAQEAARKRRRKSASKKIGAVSLSNADTVNRAMRVRSRLYAKMDEIFASDLEPKMKMSLAKDVMIKINKVEDKIASIRRRERAILEEQSRKKNESEATKRRRQHDMKKRSISIRKDYLFSAENGGFDPNDFNLKMPSGGACVSFQISGMEGGGEVAVMAAEVSAGEMEASV
jgi:hypothetical protein